MSSVSKKIITLVILTSFLAIAFFSFALMIHSPDGRMQGDCPLSAIGQSLCPQDTVAIAIHHISAYNAFFNVPVGLGLTAFIISLLFLTCVIFVIFESSLLLGPPTFTPILYDSPLIVSYKIKITRWLSLFENSPSYF